MTIMMENSTQMTIIRIKMMKMNKIIMILQIMTRINSKVEEELILRMLKSININKKK